jgi:hypothetical protein
MSQNSIILKTQEAITVYTLQDNYSQNLHDLQNDSYISILHKELRIKCTFVKKRRKECFHWINIILSFHKNMIHN